MVTPVPPEVVFVEPPSCISAKIGWDRKIRCNTVVPNGSDFTITGPSPVKVVRVDKSKCDALGLTDTLTLYFEESVMLPGTYTLGFKTGTDGNGILDTCGKEAIVPFNFVVSDKGVTATASPSILCEPGYTDLSAVPLNPPSNYTPVCGTAQGPFVGTNTLNAIVGTGTTITDGAPLTHLLRLLVQCPHTNDLQSGRSALPAACFRAGLTSCRLILPPKGLPFPTMALPSK